MERDWMRPRTLSETTRPTTRQLKKKSPACHSILDRNFFRGRLPINSEQNCTNQNNSCASEKGADGLSPTDFVENGDAPDSSDKKAALGQWIADGKAERWKACKDVSDVPGIPESACDQRPGSVSASSLHGEIEPDMMPGRKHFSMCSSGISETAARMASTTMLITIKENPNPTA